MFVLPSFAPSSTQLQDGGMCSGCQPEWAPSEPFFTSSLALERFRAGQGQMRNQTRIRTIKHYSWSVQRDIRTDLFEFDPLFNTHGTSQKFGLTSMIFKEKMLHLDKYKMQLPFFFFCYYWTRYYFFLGHCIIPILWIQSVIKAEMVFVQTFDFW